MRITHGIAAVGAAMALSGAVAVGASGTAEAATPRAATTATSTATSTAGTATAGVGPTVSMPVELAACHRVWHPGAWFWWSHPGWDWRHPWLRRWERRQHPGWWDCR